MQHRPVHQLFNSCICFVLYELRDARHRRAFGPRRVLHQPDGERCSSFHTWNAVFPAPVFHTPSVFSSDGILVGLWVRRAAAERQWKPQQVLIREQCCCTSVRLRAFVSRCYCTTCSQHQRRTPRATIRTFLETQRCVHEHHTCERGMQTSSNNMKTIIFNPPQQRSWHHSVPLVTYWVTPRCWWSAAFCRARFSLSCELQP